MSPRDANAPVGEPCEALPWDTQFFGFPVARLRADRLTIDQCALVDAYCRAHRPACLYFLARPDDPDTIALAHEYEYFLADVRLTFELPKPASRAPDPRVGPVTAGDLPALRALARVSHTDSRFYFDKRFPRDRCDALYETWIENDVRASLAGLGHAALVARDAAGTAVGYVTCASDDTVGGAAKIGLVAVAAGHQGEGLGTALVNAAVNWAAAAGAGLVSVVTQGRNLTAQRLYERAGFLVRELQLYYHRWL